MREYEEKIKKKESVTFTTDTIYFLSIFSSGNKTD